MSEQSKTADEKAKEYHESLGKVYAAIQVERYCAFIAGYNAASTRELELVEKIEQNSIEYSKTVDKMWVEREQLKSKLTASEAQVKELTERLSKYEK